LQAVRT